MSHPSAWTSLLVPPTPPADLPRRPDDPRLGEVAEFWTGDPAVLRSGRCVLVGFPQDEGVRRNGGRVGAAEAPREIRRWLYRYVPWDVESGADLGDDPLLDLGDIRVDGTLEESQEALGEVVAAVLRAGATPVVLGGGHETAYGHYLGYVKARIPVAVVNVDAHLDVRPLIEGKGHSGSPFRQMLEHPTARLAGDHYFCLGLSPQSLSRAHLNYVKARGSTMALEDDGVHGDIYRQATEKWRCPVLLSVDADVVRAADVPGVSAPNPHGLSASVVASFVRSRGHDAAVRSLDLVEINPRFDVDGRSARWAALLVWHFLCSRAALAGASG